MKKKIIPLLNIALLLFMYSCVREDIFIDEAFHESPTITVSDAKAYFEENITVFKQLEFFSLSENKKADVQAQTHVHTGACEHNCEKTMSRTLMTTHDLPDIGLNPEWNKGVAYRKDSVSIVEIPVSANVITKSEQKKRIRKATYKRAWTTVSRKIIMAKRTSDTPAHMFMVTLIPSQECEDSNDGNSKDFRYLGGSKFSGLVLCSEMDGTYGDIFEYKDGQKVRRLQVIPMYIIREKRLNIKRYMSLDLQNRSLATTRWGNPSEKDPKCPNCRLLNGGCWEHDINYRDPVEVVEEFIFCEDCGRPIAQCNCAQYCRDCGNYKIFCICDYYPEPTCWLCGSTYCFGECQSNSGGGGGGPIGGGSSSSSPSSAAPLASKVFFNATLSEDDWRDLERMIKEMILDCMGQAVYNGLINSLGSNRINFSFSNASYYSTDDFLTLRHRNRSDELFHEMFHGYQEKHKIQNATYEKLNREMETRYAHFKYVERQSKYKSEKWAERAFKGIGTYMVILDIYLDSKGNLKENFTDLELKYGFEDTADMLQMSNSAYSSYTFDYYRSGKENLKNYLELIKDCL